MGDAFWGTLAQINIFLFFLSCSLGHAHICLPHSPQRLLSDARSSYSIKVLNFADNLWDVYHVSSATFYSFLGTTVTWKSLWLQDVLAGPDLHNRPSWSNLGDHLPRFFWPAEGPWWLSSDLRAELPFQIVTPPKFYVSTKTPVSGKCVIHLSPPSNVTHDKCFSEFPIVSGAWRG